MLHTKNMFVINYTHYILEVVTDAAYKKTCLWLYNYIHYILEVVTYSNIFYKLSNWSLLLAMFVHFFLEVYTSFEGLPSSNFASVSRLQFQHEKSMFLGCQPPKREREDEEMKFITVWRLFWLRLFYVVFVFCFSFSLDLYKNSGLLDSRLVIRRSFWMVQFDSYSCGLLVDACWMMLDPYTGPPRQRERERERERNKKHCHHQNIARFRALCA